MDFFREIINYHLYFTKIQLNLVVELIIFCIRINLLDKYNSMYSKLLSLSPLCGQQMYDVIQSCIEEI